MPSRVRARRSSTSASHLDRLEPRQLLDAAGVALDAVTTFITDTGTDPEALVVADFNGDGRLDAAVQQDDENSVLILLGRDDGLFGTPSASIPLPVFDPPGPGVATFNGGKAMIAADVDNDDDIDIIVSSLDTSAFYIIRNNGNATVFNVQTVQNASPGDGYDDIAYVDVNSDSAPDLIGMASFEDRVEIFLGLGDGTFQTTSTNFDAGDLPRDVELADLDGDGRLDLITAADNDDEVRIRLGVAGTSLFASDFTTLGTSDPFDIATADLNNDGQLDLAVAKNNRNNFAVIYNNSTPGNLAFTGGETLDSGSSATSVAAGDLDADGDTEVYRTESNGFVDVIRGGNGGVQADEAY
ncbi:MAG: VCBS repeat-containing protein, partial [Planctomycetota bacterium]